MPAAENQPADLFNEASALHAAKKLDEAEKLYRRCIEADSKHADALHMLGALLLQRYGKGKGEEAKQAISKAINLNPRSAKFRHSLGIVHQEMGNWKDALDAFERANEKDPMNVQYLMSLGRALRELNRHQRAAEVYAAVTRLRPDHPTAHYKRGALLRNLRGREEEAVACFRAHLKIRPDHSAARFWIAAITGDAEAMGMAGAAPADMVADLFDQYADHFDEHLVEKLQYRTPEKLRDELEAAFKERAASGSTATSSAATSSTGGSSGSGGQQWGLRCVDLGCGTGLMGPLLRRHVRTLEGVDLSAGMVDQARKRGCYDRLAVDELVHFLATSSGNSETSTQPAIECESSAVAAGSQDGNVSSSGNGASSSGKGEPYDLLVAADVFVYIGDLGPVMAAATAASSETAVFGFSVEALLPPEEDPQQQQQQGTAKAQQTQQQQQPQEAPSANGTGSSTGSKADALPPFRLQPTGRYAHTEAYVRQLAAGAGWRVVRLRREVIRNNGGLPVHGYLCVLSR